MNAGALDREVTIRRATVTTKDEFNADVEAWADLATVWAAKRDVRDAERIAAAATGASVTTRFQFRAEDVPTLSPEDQLVCEGQTYSIEGVKEMAEGRRRWIEATATRKADVA